MVALALLNGDELKAGGRFTTVIVKVASAVPPVAVARTTKLSLAAPVGVPPSVPSAATLSQAGPLTLE